ncbi:MAG: tetratricopeptide repeat protein [Acidobacteria bacterium]|nr:tetratricopeptide repeat protein [Acidobacteriota bacterium]
MDEFTDPLIEDLRTQIAAMRDDRARGELLDTLWRALAAHGRWDEALTTSAQLLELHRAMTERDPVWETRLASTLFNHATLLRSLGRVAEAVDVHVQAHRIRERHIADSAEDATAYARNAEGLAAALADLRGYDMAARFQGAAVAAWLRLQDASGVGPAGGHPSIGTLGAYLDAMDSDEAALHPEAALSTHPQLMAIETGSARTAQHIVTLALDLRNRGNIDAATLWAARAIRYCELFATDEEGFAATSVEMMRQVALWTTAAGVRSPFAPVARLKGLLGREPLAVPPQPATDSRLWCCSARDLLLILADLARDGVPGSDVHALADRLRAARIYPARDYRHRCQPRLPDVFITYDWRFPFVTLQETIHRTLLMMGRRIHERRSDLDPRDVHSLVLDQIGLWIDFVFIDQSARDVAADVREILPKVIAAADVHLVVSDTALSRAWCCYELAVFNTRPVPASAFQGGKWHGIPVDALDSTLARPLRSVIAQRQTLAYRGFDATATTVTTDKAEIEGYLRDEFPEGLDGVDRLLLQVGLLSDTSVTPGFALYPAAEDAILTAADKWLAR